MTAPACWSPSSRRAPAAAAEPDPLVRAAAGLLERAPVAEVAGELAVSERHLRRLVSAEVGYGPKLLGRVLRLRRALGRVRAGAELAEVAHGVGYADQAHFTQRVQRAGRGAAWPFFPRRRGLNAPRFGVMSARLGWVIVYVPDVEAAIAFYERAFGLERRFVAPDASFGELDTGTTRLAFASEQMGDSHFEGGFERPKAERPFNFEVALVFDDVEAAFARALEAGGSTLTEPAQTSWGQTIAYVRDPFGTLVELATPDRLTRLSHMWAR